MMRDQKMDLMPDERKILQNPVCMVFVGEIPPEIGKVPGLHQWTSNSVILLKLGKDSANIEGLHFAVDLALNVAGSVEWDDESKRNLDLAVRKSKLIKYQRKGDINVCILVGRYQGKLDFPAIIRALYEAFHLAYLNCINFDLYYIVKEDYFLLQNQRRSIPDFWQQLNAVQLEKAVRFVFLLSEISSEEVVAAETEQIYELAIDTIALGNGVCNLSENERRDLFQELQELALADGSKLFTLGKKELFLEDNDKITALKCAFAEKLLQIKEPKGKYFRGRRLELESLNIKLREELIALQNGLPFIGYYAESTIENARNCIPGDFLSQYYGDNYLDYMRINYNETRKCAAKHTTMYCQTYVSAWLNEKMLGNMSKLLDKKYIEQLSAFLKSELTPYQQKNNEETRAARERLEQWLSEKRLQKRRWWKRKPYDYQLDILMEWGSYQAECYYYDIMRESLSEIERYVDNWIRHISFMYQMVNTFFQTAFWDWEQLLLSADEGRRWKLDRLLRDMIHLLSEKKEAIDTVRERIYNYFLQGNTEKADFCFMVEQLLSEINKQYNIIGLVEQKCQDDNAENEQHLQIEDMRVLQMRGEIYNEDLVSAFLSRQNNRNSAILYCQHIKSLEQLPIYNFFNTVHE